MSPSNNAIEITQAAPARTASLPQTELQLVRARREEALLTQQRPGYATYKPRDPPLVPRLT